MAGSRVEVASYKKNAGDFVLWKPSIRNGVRPVALSSADVPNAANSDAVNDATTKLDAELGL